MRLIPNSLFPAFFVFYLLQGLVFFAQEGSQDELVVKSLAKKVSAYYTQNKYLCYTFEKREFLKNQGGWLVSHGDVKIFTDHDRLFYRVKHGYDSIKGAPYKKDFDAIYNEQHCGTNQNAYSYFKDYTALFKPRKYYTLSDWPNTVLSPDNYLETLFCSKLYRPVLRLKKEVYELELRDTVSGTAGNNWWYVFYISKKDFRVVKQVSRAFQSLNDSTVCHYSYYTEAPETIRSYVDAFAPFNGRKSQNISAYRDTVSFIPELTLPDINGKTVEPATPYVLINFWYEGCHPCLENLDYLEKIHFKKLTVISVNIADTLTAVRREQLSRYHFAIVFGGAELAERLNIQGFPKTYVMDRQRRILFRHTDYSNAPALQSFLEKLCADY